MSEYVSLYMSITLYVYLPIEQLNNSNTFLYGNVFVCGTDTPVLNLRRYASFVSILFWSVASPVTVNIQCSGWSPGHGAKARRARIFLEMVTGDTTASVNFPDDSGRLWV